MRARILAFAAVLSWSKVGDARAQERAARATVEAMPAAQDPSASSVMTSPSAVAILEGTAKGKAATARIGVQARDLLFDLKLSGPLDDHETQLASLRGLAGSTTLSAGLGWIRWHPTPDPVRMQAACDSYTRRTGRALRDCAYLDLPEGRWRRRFDNAVHFGTPLFLSIRGTVGSRSFSWIDTTSLAASSARHTVSAIDASLGLYREGIGFFLLSFGYEVSWSAGDPVQICRPLGAGGALRCDDRRVQSPGRDRSSLVSFEYRRLVGTAAGLRPTLTYRTASRIWGFQLPLYFLRDQQGLTGGVSLGWRSDTREAALTAFVGDVLGMVTGP